MKMSRNGSNPTAEEIAAKEAQERELKAAQVDDLTGKAPRYTPSNIESSDDSSSDSDSHSDSSDEDVKDGDDPTKKAAKNKRKAKKKKKAVKMAKKLLMKMIKKEQAKYTHSGFYEVPHNYEQIPGNNSNEKFYSVHLGKPPHFDGKDYPKWGYDMQMHCCGDSRSYRAPTIRENKSSRTKTRIQNKGQPKALYLTVYFSKADPLYKCSSSLFIGRRTNFLHSENTLV
jgi:hypothetical protein